VATPHLLSLKERTAMSIPSAPPSMPTAPRQARPITEFRGDNRFLSNFWPVPGGVSLTDRHGPTMTGLTVEHVFQAAKTMDLDARLAVLAEPTAGKAKIAGQQVPLREDWDAVKLGVMAHLQAAKYSNPEMAALLLGTEDADLVEGNHWHDLYWGVCDCMTHRAVGSNHLGQILMIQRSVLHG
jgi:ribA/ribD-fused uncharacterized protein